MTEQIRWRQWAIVGLLTLFWHFFLFLAPWQKLFPPRAFELPKRIEIQQVDPKKLDAIRKQWRSKKLLLSKSQEESEKAAPDARYLSDKNKTVEREQRATHTNVIPKPGQGSADETSPAQKSRPRGLPKLSQLGVPLYLGEKQPKARIREERSQHPPSIAGGDQALDEKDLPAGSENLLNTQQSIYYSFYSRLYQEIGPVWQSRIRDVPYSRRVPAGEYVTQVEVVMDRTGNLVDIHFIKSSGIAEFDAAVETSWKRVGKFPNPPSGLLERDGNIHTGWTFAVQVGSDFSLDYAPPRRNY